MHRCAVIDLGTNTFHLLIAQPTETGFEVLYKERRFVKLAENGIEHIGLIPFQRGLQAMLHFKDILETYQVQAVNAFGTAALRTADNGQAFIETVLEQTDISVQLISGDLEAALIHKGVMQALPPLAANLLIMDIGGGSVEFILCNASQVFWARSFPIGVAVLYHRFKHSNPATEAELHELEHYLQEVLAPLQAILQQYPVTFLVGASGTFDVLENNLPNVAQHKTYTLLRVEDYYQYHHQLITTTLEQRLQMEGIPKSRAEMLIVAFVLIQHVFRLLPASELFYVSDYAMKEGILAEMIARQR